MMLEVDAFNLEYDSDTSLGRDTPTRTPDVYAKNGMSLSVQCLWDAPPAPFSGVEDVWFVIDDTEDAKTQAAVAFPQPGPHTHTVPSWLCAPRRWPQQSTAHAASVAFVSAAVALARATSGVAALPLPRRSTCRTTRALTSIITPLAAHPSLSQNSPLASQPFTPLASATYPPAQSKPASQVAQLQSVADASSPPVAAAGAEVLKEIAVVRGSAPLEPQLHCATAADVVVAAGSAGSYPHLDALKVDGGREGSPTGGGGGLSAALSNVFFEKGFSEKPCRVVCVVGSCGGEGGAAAWEDALVGSFEGRDPEIFNVVFVVVGGVVCVEACHRVARRVGGVAVLAPGSLRGAPEGIGGLVHCPAGCFGSFVAHVLSCKADTPAKRVVATKPSSDGSAKDTLETENKGPTVAAAGQGVQEPFLRPPPQIEGAAASDLRLQVTLPPTVERIRPQVVSLGRDRARRGSTLQSVPAVQLGGAAGTSRAAAPAPTPPPPPGHSPLPLRRVSSYATSSPSQGAPPAPERSPSTPSRSPCTLSYSSPSVTASLKALRRSPRGQQRTDSAVLPRQAAALRYSGSVSSETSDGGSASSSSVPQSHRRSVSSRTSSPLRESTAYTSSPSHNTLSSTLSSSATPHGVSHSSTSLEEDSHSSEISSDSGISSVSSFGRPAQTARTPPSMVASTPTARAPKRPNSPPPAMIPPTRRPPPPVIASKHATISRMPSRAADSARATAAATAAASFAAAVGGALGSRVHSRNLSSSGSTTSSTPTPRTIARLAQEQIAIARRASIAAHPPPTRSSLTAASHAMPKGSSGVRYDLATLLAAESSGSDKETSPIPVQASATSSCVPQKTARERAAELLAAARAKRQSQTFAPATAVPQRQLGGTPTSALGPRPSVDSSPSSPFYHMSGAGGRSSDLPISRTLAHGSGMSLDRGGSSVVCMTPLDEGSMASLTTRGGGGGDGGIAVSPMGHQQGPSWAGDGHPQGRRESLSGLLGSAAADLECLTSDSALAQGGRVGRGGGPRDDRERGANGPPSAADRRRPAASGAAESRGGDDGEVHEFVFGHGDDEGASDDSAAADEYAHSVDESVTAPSPAFFGRS